MRDNDLPPGVDPTVPSSGRMYDYYLGGTDHLEVDRAAAQMIVQMVPEITDAAWANRGFLQRASAWLAGEAGIDQFLDVGAGLPTRNNTHEAAQKQLPGARVAYVDKDPLILAHANQLLQDVPHTTFIEGDVREPDAILDHPEVRARLDFSRPAAVLLVAVLHFVSDAEDPIGLIRRYLDAFPSGSYLVLSHATSDFATPEMLERARAIYAKSADNVYPRPRAEIEAMFDGLQLVPPYAGAAPEVTYVSLWGAEDVVVADSEGGRIGYCGVARKP